MSLQFGYLNEDPPEDPRQLSRYFFPSKFGGNPAWLIPENYPKDLNCSRCSKKMGFLMQIYAPRNAIEEDSNSFHRQLYLFTCKKCPDQFRCFRSQLTKLNSYYSSDNPHSQDVFDVITDAVMNEDPDRNKGIKDNFGNLKIYDERELEAEGEDESDSSCGDDENNSSDSETEDSDTEKWELLEDSQALLKFREHVAASNGKNLKMNKSIKNNDEEHQSNENISCKKENIISSSISSIQ